MQIHYLEIVAPEVDASVALYSKIHGVSFGAAEESLGGARGQIGERRNTGDSSSIAKY